MVRGWASIEASSGALCPSNQVGHPSKVQGHADEVEFTADFSEPPKVELPEAKHEATGEEGSCWSPLVGAEGAHASFYAPLAHAVSWDPGFGTGNSRSPHYLPPFTLGIRVAVFCDPDS